MRHARRHLCSTLSHMDSTAVAAGAWANRGERFAGMQRKAKAKSVGAVAEQTENELAAFFGGRRRRGRRGIAHQKTRRAHHRAPLIISALRIMSEESNNGISVESSVKANEKPKMAWKIMKAMKGDERKSAISIGNGGRGEKRRRTGRSSVKSSVGLGRGTHHEDSAEARK